MKNSYFRIMAFLLVLCIATLGVLTFQGLSASERGRMQALILLDTVPVLSGYILLLLIFIALLGLTLRAMVVNANRAIEESDIKAKFMANMGHEIRTLMNGVIGFSELALQDFTDIPPKLEDYLYKIKNNSVGIMDIMNDLVDISRIETDSLVLERIPFSIHELFRSCETIVTAKAAEKGLDVYFYSEPFVEHKLIGDPARLRQVIVNLLSSSIKYTNSGTIKLDISIDDQSEDQVSIRFEVKDPGIGMTEDQIEQALKPYNKSDAASTYRLGKTGLGLPITKRLVELMGGNLSIDSTPGLGSRFYFTLAFKVSEDMDANYIPEETLMIEQQRPYFQGTVLVCEDNPVNQDVIREQLRIIGLDPVIAENGKEGVEIALERMERGEPFDIILMDIQMPVMDGLDASKELTAQGCTSPIIALTANIMTQDMEFYQKHGIRDYLYKPFVAQELWICLMKFLTPAQLAFGESLTYKPGVLDSLNMAEDLSDYVTISGNEIVDVDGALQRASGNRFLYHRAQAEFYHKYTTIFSDINERILLGEIAQARDMAHNLAGFAYIIGADKLKNAAARIEAALSREPPSYSDGDMNNLGESIHEVLDFLEKYGITTESEDIPIQVFMEESFDSKTGLRILDTVESYLQASDITCLTLIPDILSRLSIIPDKAELLGMQIVNYEFDRALKTVQEIRQEIDEKL